MRDHSNTIKGFHRLSKAFYTYPNSPVQVSFGMYDAEDGSTSGEMMMEWVELIPGELSALFKCYDDGWSAMALFTDLINELGTVDSQQITEEEFCKILVKFGFKDLTNYE